LLVAFKLPESVNPRPFPKFYIRRWLHKFQICCTV